jgi:transcriptional regulator with XRE-family HTH domain
MTSDPARDNTMRAALRKAAMTKREEREKRKAERKAHTEAKLELLREKQAKPKPGPQRPDWGDDPEPLPAFDPEMKMLREQMERIANSGGRGPERRRRTFGPPPVVERLPSRKPPVVAAAAASPAPSAPRVSAPVPALPPADKPLQTSAFPEAFMKVLEEGTPTEIAAGRDPATLKGIEAEAYARAVERKEAAKVHNPAPGGAGTARLPKALPKLAEIGHVIHRLRLERDMTVETLQERAGMSKDTLWRIATGRRPLLAKDRDALAAALSVHKETLGPVGEFTAKTGRPKAPPPPPETPEPPAPPVPEPQAATPEIVPDPIPTAQPVEKRGLLDPHPDDTVAQAVVRNHLKRIGSNPGAFSLALGYSHETIRRWLRVPGSRLSPVTLQKVAAAIKVPLGSLAQECGPQDAPAAPAPIAAAEAQPAIHAQREEPEPAAPITPPIEKGIPVPLDAIIIHADRYNWAGLGIGDSFFAECPFGMTLPLFEQRFANLLYRQQKKTGAWYVSESDEKANGLRVWRVA